MVYGLEFFFGDKILFLFDAGINCMVYESNFGVLPISLFSS